MASAAGGGGSRASPAIAGHALGDLAPKRKASAGLPQSPSSKRLASAASGMLLASASAEQGTVLLRFRGCTQR